MDDQPYAITFGIAALVAGILTLAIGIWTNLHD
jgi:hypothetical protein